MKDCFALLNFRKNFIPSVSFPAGCVTQFILTLPSRDVESGFSFPGGRWCPALRRAVCFPFSFLRVSL